MKLPHAISNLTLLTALLLVGCIGSKYPGEERNPATGGSMADSSFTDSRGFDPLELSADRDVVPAEHKIKADIHGRIEMQPEDSSGGEVVSTDVPGVPAQVDTLSSQVYRIQIFTSKLYGEARKAMHVAEEIFDRPVFVDYEVPNFKVRVGNFVDRDEAEEYEQRVKAAGYKTAWVVMVTVNVKKAESLYDQFMIEQYQQRDSSAAEDDSSGQ